MERDTVTGAVLFLAALAAGTAFGWLARAALREGAQPNDAPLAPSSEPEPRRSVGRRPSFEEIQVRLAMARLGMTSEGYLIGQEPKPKPYTPNVTTNKEG